MIAYEPGKWGFWFSLTCHGSVFPKSFCIAFPCSCLTLFFHFLIKCDVIQFDRNSESADQVSSTVLGGFSFILGFLIVFRSQQAYTRWWEGGTLLQQIRGEWFNAFSSLLAFCNPSAERKAAVFEFQHHLVRLVSLLYGSALEQVTTMEKAVFEMIDLDGFPIEHLQFITGCHDRVEIVLQWLQKLIVDSEADGTINIAPPILSRVYNQLGNGIVNLNNARKITEFPIPFPLAQMVQYMLVVHWWITLYISVVYVSNPAWGFLVSFTVVQAFWSINYISMELEMPFGDDLNDLPLQQMQNDFNRSLISLMQPLSLSPPKFKLESWHGELRTSKVDFETYIEQLCESHNATKTSCNRTSVVPRRQKQLVQKRLKGARMSRLGTSFRLADSEPKRTRCYSGDNVQCVSWQVWSTKSLRDRGEEVESELDESVNASHASTRQASSGYLPILPSVRKDRSKKDTLEACDIEIKLPQALLQDVDVLSSDGCATLPRIGSSVSVAKFPERESDSSLLRLGLRMEEHVLQIVQDLRDVKAWELGSQQQRSNSISFADTTRVESRSIDSNVFCWSNG